MKETRNKNADKKRIKEQRKNDKRLLKEQLSVQENVHTKLIVIVVFMSAFGLLMVYSASAFNCSQNKLYNYDSFYFVKKHLIYLAMGMIIVFMSQFVGFVRLVEHFARAIYILSFASVLMLMTPFAVSSHGATRWVRIAGMQFQPAELLKIGVIIMLAYMTKRFSKSLNKVVLTLLMWSVGIAPAFVLMKLSSDLSSAVIILAITVGITFITTRQVPLHLFLIGLAGAFGGIYLHNFAQHLPTPEELENMSYRTARIAAWIKPERYASGKGYQVLNSLYAVGSGGWIGKGLGRSIMKLEYIPEAHNDMIFAIICEELGIFGGLLLIFMFIYMIYLMLRICLNSETLFESVLVMGILIHIASQTFINMAVAVNLFPNTGVPLPFISYGGTSLVCNLGEIALVVGVARKHFIRRGQRTVHEEKMKEN